MEGSYSGQQQPIEKPTMTFGWKHFILMIVFYIGSMIALQFGVSIAAAIIDPTSLDAEEILSPSVYLLIDALAFTLVFFIYKPVRHFLKRAFDSTVFKHPSTYAYIVFAFLAIFIMQYILLTVMGVESNNQQDKDLGLDFIQTTGQQWLFFIVVAVITPIKEEMIFRGTLYRFFTEKYHFWIGLFVSSIVFGVLHGGLPITASLMGIIIALLYRKTNSLYPPIILHMLWNAFASVGVFL